MSDCGCGCAEAGQQTPEPTANRAGLTALAYRVGTHASFLATMRARLASAAHPALRGLRTRATDDPAIALLDAWACVADVLCFYNERIINEGYLRTATERRSLVELGRLIGYTPRPGVAASTFLAYTVEETATGDVQIPAGARAQSVPGPGEQPQSFETAEPLTARAAWNALKPRTRRPPFITLDTPGPVSPYDARLIKALFFKGISTNLRPGDLLLLVFGDAAGQQVPRRVQAIEALPAENRTRVALQPLTQEYALGQFLAYWKTIDADGTISKLIREAIGTASASGHKQGPPYRRLKRILKRLVVPVEQMELIIDSLETELKLKWAAANANPAEFSLRGFLEAFLQEILPLPTISEDRIVQAVNIALQLLRHTIITADHPFTKALQEGEEPLEGRVLQATRKEGTRIKLAIDVALKIHPQLSKPLWRPAEPLPIVAAKDLIPPLIQRPSRPPRSSQAVRFDPARRYDKRSDDLFGIMSASNPRLSGTPSAALAAATDAPPPMLKAVYAMRVKAAPHGHNAPRASLVFQGGRRVLRQEWEIDQRPDSLAMVLTLTRPNGHLWTDNFEITPPGNTTSAKLLPLDAPYEQITAGSWVVVERPDRPVYPVGDITPPIIAQALRAETVARTEYTFPAKVTRLTLSAPWLSASDKWLSDIRNTTVYAQSEALELADEPITSVLADDTIELDGLYTDLKAGRWLIVCGERADLPGISGVRACELVILSAVSHGPQDAPEQPTAADPPVKLAGDTAHTRLRLAAPLSYRYRRESVTIYGNVVRATNGETRAESLGGGDASRPFQRFTLRQGPLTYLAAPTAAGAESTLQVRVNDVLWHPVARLSALGPNDRGYTTSTDDDGTVSGVFGDGVHGARPPSGVENIRALYRTGLGAAGNLRAGQISLLTTRPAGVRAVINPMPASGGADRDGPEAIRTGAPLTVTALDRLVATQDYADFARTFAGIGKAHAARLSDGARETVFLTVAGTDDIPLDRDSDLLRNLRQALRRAGDPSIPLQVAVRRLLLLLLKARVRVHPDYLWEQVEPQVRAALLDAFSFARRDLGQPAYAATALVAIQRVPGVVYVDLDTFGAFDALDEHGLPQAPEQLSKAIQFVMTQAAPQQVVHAALPAQRGLVPAQISYLVPAVAQTTLLLEELQ